MSEDTEGAGTASVSRESTSRTVSRARYDWELRLPEHWRRTISLAPLPRAGLHTPGGLLIVSDGSTAACVAACIAASRDMNNAACAASAGLDTAAEEAGLPIWDAGGGMVLHNAAPGCWVCARGCVGGSKPLAKAEKNLKWLSARNFAAAHVPDWPHRGRLQSEGRRSQTAQPAERTPGQ